MRRTLIHLACSPEEERIVRGVYWTRKAVRKAEKELRFLDHMMLDPPPIGMPLIIAGGPAAIEFAARAQKRYLRERSEARIRLIGTLRKAVSAGIERWKLKLAG